MVKVAVIGAGVIGLSTAYLLKIENPSIDVHIVADSTSPNTCTDVAAGLWEPYVMRDTPVDLVRYLHDLVIDELAGNPSLINKRMTRGTMRNIGVD